MIRAQRRGPVLEILLENLPLNLLNTTLRQGVVGAISEAQRDPAVMAIVIRGAGTVFSSGADIRVLADASVDPLLAKVASEIEASAKPVVAAIHGTALGGGLELALACHYRIATRDARLGLPEVKQGMIPGAGGSQRLPRLVGVKAALDMIVSGETISATQARDIGLIDRLADESTLAEDAIAWAAGLDVPRRTGELPVDPASDVFETHRKTNARKFHGLDAPQACITAVEAATQLTLAQGLAKERDLFLTVVNGEQSKALRHLFFAERAAGHVEDLARDTSPREINRVGVVGAGTMGGGIAMNFLSAGIPVTIVEMNAQALERGVGVVRRNYESSAAKGRISAEQVEKAMGLLEPTLDFTALRACDMVIEAVYEDMAVKRVLFARLDATARPGAILASNTSFLDVNTLAQQTGRPRDVLGLHFFSPANVMKLLEVVRGSQTADDVLATAMQLARRIGKVPVVAKVCHGFIGNRMLEPRQIEATKLLLEGATPEQVDQVHTRFGMPMGPFQMADLAGLDIGWHRDAQRIESVRDALCARGRWGQKTKAGYYDYDDGRKPSPSPVVTQIIESFRARSGVVSRVIDDDELVVRTFYTMINEGAKILEEGIAQRASDIDVVWANGYGWPRHTGGPLFWAARVGLDKVVRGLEHFVEVLGPEFEISPYLRRKAAEGAREL